MKNRVVSRNILLLAALLAEPSIAHDINLRWSPVATAATGEPIDSAYITYNLYMASDTEPYVKISTTSLTNHLEVVDQTGCYRFYVTAYRSDTHLESAASNEESRCIDEPPSTAGSDQTPSDEPPSTVASDQTPSPFWWWPFG